MEDESFAKTICQIAEKSEREVAQFLDRIGLRFIAANSKFGKQERIGEIDLIVTDESLVYVIEISTNKQRDHRRRKRKKLREWECKKKQIRTKHELDANCEMCFVYIDLSRPELTNKDINRNDPCLNTIIIYDHELKMSCYKKGVDSAEGFQKLVTDIRTQIQNNPKQTTCPTSKS